MGAIELPFFKFVGGPVHTSFPHMLWKFKTQIIQGQVTWSRQVTWPHKRFKCSSQLHRQKYCLENFSDWCEYKYENSIYKMYTLEFWHWLPNGESILWHLHHNSMREIGRRFYWTKPIQTLAKIGLQVDLTPWVGILRPVTLRHITKAISFHERSPAVFFGNSFW